MKKIILSILALFVLFITATVFAMPSGEKVTIVGKMVIKKNNFIEINVKDDVPHYLDIDDLKKATKEFRQCVDDGKYKGVVEITTITGTSRDAYSTNLELNSKSTCKRK